MCGGTSLEVQWLRFRVFTAGGMGLIPGWGAKILYAVRCCQELKKEKILEEAERPEQASWRVNQGV